jgi:transcriptional regulator with XRE-family HTH domain
MNSLEAIGKKLRELRIKKGYTSYEHFAYDFDLTRQTVGRAEQGKNISLKTLQALLKIHKITFEEFFKGIK